MYRLVYVSAAVGSPTRADLLALLAKAREKNDRLGITGLLLFKDGDFIQLLEGERPAVREVFDAIQADPRHSGVIVLLEGEAEGRLFADWSMGFRDLADPEVRAMPGFSPYMNTPLVAESFGPDPSGCLELLSLFKPPV
jgi:hypothetical protein